MEPLASEVWTSGEKTIHVYGILPPAFRGWFSKQINDSHKMSCCFLRIQGRESEILSTCFALQSWAPNACVQGFGINCGSTRVHFDGNVMFCMMRFRLVDMTAVVVTENEGRFRCDFYQIDRSAADNNIIATNNPQATAYFKGEHKGRQRGAVGDFTTRVIQIWRSPLHFKLQLFLLTCAWFPNGYQVQSTQGIVDKIL